MAKLFSLEHSLAIEKLRPIDTDIDKQIDKNKTHALESCLDYR